MPSKDKRFEMSLIEDYGMDHAGEHWVGLMRDEAKERGNQPAEY